jgi:hypothetical protein
MFTRKIQKTEGLMDGIQLTIKVRIWDSNCVCNFSFIVDNRTIISKWWFLNFYLNISTFTKTTTSHSLWPQYPNDKPAYLYRRTKRGQQYKLGLDVVYVSGSKLVLNNYHSGHKKALDLRPYILAYLTLLFQGKLALSSIYISTTQAVAGRQFSIF